MTFEQNRRGRGWMRAVPYGSGVVRNLDPRWIPDDASPDLLNVDLQDVSRPRKRLGYVPTEAGASGLLPGARISGLGFLDDGPGSRLLAVAQTAAGGAGQVSWVRSPDEKMWTVAGTLNLVTDDVEMFQGNFMLWLMTGRGVQTAVLTTSGELIEAGDANGSPPLVTVGGAWLFSRVWFVDDRRLYWSKIFPTAEDVRDQVAFDRANLTGNTVNHGSLELSAPFGGKPIAMTVWNGQSLIIHYDIGHMEVVVNNADPLFSSIKVMEARFGCSSRDSIVVVGKEVYFQDQYGDYRSLVQTITGAREGMAAEPISESLRRAGELAGGMTDGQLHKTRAFAFQDYLYLFQATGVGLETNSAWVLDTNNKIWYGPYQFAHEFSKLLVAAARGTKQAIFASSADPARTVVYELFRGASGDDGVDIEYRETGKMFTGGIEEKNKQPRFVDCWARGQPGIEFKVRLRTNEDHVWTRVAAADLEGNDSIFPILEAGEPGHIFPIPEAGETGSPFPIVDSFGVLTRAYENLEVPEPGVFDIPNSAFAIPSGDFSLLDTGGGVVPGRFVQYQISEKSRAPFERAALHVALDVQETVRDSED